METILILNYLAAKPGRRSNREIPEFYANDTYAFHFHAYAAAIQIDMSLKDTATSLSLKQWHEGDHNGVETLLENHASWIHAVVRKKMGALLRKKAETLDYVQDAMIEFLRYGPRVMINSDDHFRNLFARIVENALRDKHGWYTARRRAVSRERPLPRDTVLYLDPPTHAQNTPSKDAQQHEEEAWIRLGLEILGPEDRQVLVFRQWDKLSFNQIGERLGRDHESARMH